MSARIDASVFVAEARKLVGVPFRHQGHSLMGVDCLGLLYVAATQAGLAVDRMPQIAKVKQHDGTRGHRWNYPRTSHPHLLEAVQLLCEPAERAMPGSLLFFQFPGKKNPQHFGVCAGETMIHAHAMRGSVVEHGYRAQWVKWTHSIWRLCGIRYG